MCRASFLAQSGCMKKIMITGIVFFLIIDGFAQSGWTYRQCIEYAIANNPNLKNAQINIESQKLNRNAALNSLIPSVNGGINYGINSGRAVDPNTNIIIESDFFSNSYSVNGSLLLFNGFRRTNRINFEKYNLRATREDYNKVKNDIAFSVMDAYINYLVYEGLEGIQKDQVAVSERELARISKRMELGLASGSERYEASARLAQEEFNLIQTQNLRRGADLDLKRLMNLSPDSTLSIQDISIDELEIIDFESDSLLSMAKWHSPQVKSLTYQVRARKHQIMEARGAMMPSLALYGNWNTGYYETITNEAGEVMPFREQFNFNRRLGYGISLSVPITEAYQRRVDVQRSLLEKEMAENNLKIGVRELEYEVDRAVLDWNGAISEYQAALKKEESMGLAFEIADKKREKGMISIMEYYEAKNNHTNAKVESLRTRLQLFLRERTLNFYMTGSLIK